MGTAAARTLLLILLLLAGFGELMSAKMVERTFSEFLLVLTAAELSFFAVIRPEEPLALFIIPLLLLIIIYRVRTLVFRTVRGKMETTASSLSVKNPCNLLRPLDHKAEQPFSMVRPPSKMGLPLIERGKVRGDNLKHIGRTPLWLRQELRKFGYRDIRQVNYLTIDDSGNFYMDLKNRKTKS
ncbi:hypothetical protein EWI07_06960 [Sporolactobacillus sp. THM7-4]|nr:hypothetical protein EWI07_06960 [Sporolactobacillus sp. THM7-4]